MNDDIQQTIELLTARVSVKEEETNKLKKLVNELCGEAGIEARYPDISDAGTSLSAIRSDHFYGQTLTAAVRNYLEIRKGARLGAATVQEIYRAIRDGGYKFDTANEDNARTSVGNALRKTSSIFHRLPNGQYGLLAWYPNAKAQPEADGSTKPLAKLKPKNATASKNTALPGVPSLKVNGNSVTTKEIRDVILSQTGEFQASDIESSVKSKFPNKELPNTKIPSVLFVLKKEKGLIREVSPRSGIKGATYAKV